MFLDRRSLLGMLAIGLMTVWGPLAVAQDHGSEEHAAEHVEAHAADAHSDAAHDGHGEYSIWTDLSFWSLVAFIGFVAAIKKLGLWGLLLNSMSEREKAEAEAISLAESELTTAQASLRESKGRMEALDEKIREILAEAERDAAYTREEITRSAEREAKGSVDRARYEIERVKNQSLHDIFEDLSNKVAAITEERLRGGLQPDDQDRLINSTLDQLAIR